MGQSSGTFLGPAFTGLMLAQAGLSAGWLAMAGCLLASLALHELGTRERQLIRSSADKPVRSSNRSRPNF